MKLRTILFTLVIAVASLGVAIQGAAPDKAQVMEYISYLQQGADEDQLMQLDTVKAVMDRYYADKGSMKPSEEQLAKEFLTICEEFYRNRDVLTDRRKDLSKLRSIFASGGPSTAAPAKPGASTAKPKIKYLDRKVSYKTRIRSGSQGLVEMVVDNRKTVILEVLSGGKMGLKQRLEMIANRIVAVDRKDKLWWMKLSVGKVNGEYVVRAPRVPDGYVVTADSDFARKSRMTPEQLAKALMSRIRDAAEESSR